MKNKLSFFLVTLAAILVSSCGSISKMKDNAKNVGYTVIPSPLEVKGGQVEFSVDVKYPAKYFNKKAIVTVTPVLKYTAGESAFNEKSFQGESVQNNNEVINYTSGGTKKIVSNAIPFNKDMMVSELVVRAKGTMGKSTADFPDMKIADGVIATEMLVVKDPRAIMAADKYVRVTSDKVVADIKYLINNAEVRASELKKAEIAALKQQLKDISADSSKTLTSIEISAYASPDGPETLNANLADKRKVSADKTIKADIKKEKIKSVTDDIFKYLVTAEDWDGFKALMEKSDIKDKELILRVLSMYSDPVVREREIKNISAAYDDVKVKILPELRRSKLIVNVNVTGKTDEQLTSIGQSNPDALTVEELLYAATLTGDFEAKLALYQAAARKAPADFRPINNVGYALVKLGRHVEAKTAFETAKQIENNEIVKNNLGVCAYMAGDAKAAEDLYTSALGAGETVNYNLGIIKITQGKYADAMSSFGQMNEVNAALAKILAKEHESAMATLNNIKSEDALVYYLKAIIGARTQNTDLMWTNLRAACAKSADLKANAAKDLEFFKFFQDATFKGIVQ